MCQEEKTDVLSRVSQIKETQSLNIRETHRRSILVIGMKTH